MPLSKRHYEQFAYRIKAERENALAILPLMTYREVEIDARLSALSNLAHALCIDFTLDNPRFDKAKFLKACGFGD